MISLISLFFVLTVQAQSYSSASCNSAYCSGCSTSDKSKCTSCISNYMLINGKCVFEGDMHCQTFSGGSYSSNTNDYCTSCNYGYKVDFLTGECVSGEEHCSSISVDSTNRRLKCSSCETGYAYTSKGCLAPPAGTVLKVAYDLPLISLTP